MASKKQMAFAWVVIICAVVAVSAIFGGRDCEVPKRGPFHWLLSGHRYVQRFAMASRYSTCRVIYDDTQQPSASGSSRAIER